MNAVNTNTNTPSFKTGDKVIAMGHFGQIVLTSTREDHKGEYAVFLVEFPATDSQYLREAWFRAERMEKFTGK